MSPWANSDPFVIPVTCTGRHNRLPAGYSDQSLPTCPQARAVRGVSDGESSHSSSDTSTVVVPVSDQAPGLPETPAGRLVDCRLPGWFPPVDSRARTAAKDRIDPVRSLFSPPPAVLTPADAPVAGRVSHRFEGTRRWTA